MRFIRYFRNLRSFVILVARRIMFRCSLCRCIGPVKSCGATQEPSVPER